MDRRLWHTEVSSLGDVVCFIFSGDTFSLLLQPFSSFYRFLAALSLRISSEKYLCTRYSGDLSTLLQRTMRAKLLYAPDQSFLGDVSITLITRGASQCLRALMAIEQKGDGSENGVTNSHHRFLCSVPGRTTSRQS
jgi:hypothetical protein